VAFPLFAEGAGRRAQDGFLAAMKKATEFGVGIESAQARRHAELARLAEDLGYGTCWVPEDFYRGAFTLASAIACSTRRLRIGMGILNPYLRHPAAIAMELGALEEISDARVVLGIGAGVRAWIEGQLGIPYRKPAAAMREAIEIIQALFAGGEVTYEGEVFTIKNLNLHFAPPRRRLPVFLGVLGPKNLEMAGEIADGLLLSAMSSAGYVKYAMQHVRIGAQRAGRSLYDFGVAANLLISIDENERAARDAARPLVAMLMPFMPPHMFEAAGFELEELTRFKEAVMEGTPAMSLVTDRFLDAFAIAGSPQRCREAVAGLIEAGVRSPVAFELIGIDPEKTFRDVHKHLMPYFL
jgi:5,10-methylenetetrahydromethanopterin reductase